MKSRRQRDSWVIWLTVVFALVAVAVFVFAIGRHRRTANEVAPPIDAPDTQPPRSMSSGEFRTKRITDGDSLTLVGSDGLDLSVRLRGIDAPELGQPYGPEAKEALQALLASATVTLSKPKKGKYGRYVANVFVGEMWVNKALVSNGHAWCDQVNSFDRTLYTAEQEAKQRAVGLWALPTPVPPWIWRAERR